MKKRFKYCNTLQSTNIANCNVNSVFPTKYMYIFKNDNREFSIASCVRLPEGKISFQLSSNLARETSNVSSGLAHAEQCRL